MNSEGAKWVGSLVELYEALYYWDWPYSLPQYDPSQIGLNRENPLNRFPFVLTGGAEQTWADNVYSSLTNVAYSDFNYYMGHCNGTELGGGARGSKFVKSYLPSEVVEPWVAALGAMPNYRMRKVTVWGCYSDSIGRAGGPVGNAPNWAEAFGIRETRVQTKSLFMKNVGLFFTGALPQDGYSGTYGGTSVEVAANFDLLWVCGPNAFPGGCDPTYAFGWVLNVVRGMSPELDNGQPTWIGFGYMPYTGIYDSELQVNNVSHISF